MLKALVLILALGAACASAHAQSSNLDRARNTVNNIRQPDPPRVSTGTVVTPQVTRPQAPRGGTDVQRMRTNPPPSPSR